MPDFPLRLFSLIGFWAWRVDAQFFFVLGTPAFSTFLPSVALLLLLGYVSRQVG